MDHFIETVRKYPCLWNSTAIEYRDQELKDAAWAEVMKETDLSSVKEVKLKWKKLRDSYRDALKRHSETQAREPSAAGVGVGVTNGHGKRGYPWKYSAHMQFLQPHMANRRKPAVEPAPAPRRPSSDSSSDSEPDPPPPPPTKRRRPAAPAPLGPPPATLAHATTTELTAQDPLDIFFNSMCQSTKRFPFQTQIKIKRSLFSAVMEAEETLLAEQQSYASLWAASSSASSEPDVKPC